MPINDNPPLRDIYSVSRLNREVRTLLEGSFPLLWVEGEISNLARPASGHIYFSLKDPQAQVRCALFRMQRQRLRFQPENGQQVLIRARVGLYEGRGEFQLIVDHMEPAGEGALRQAFEQLKQKLAAEGLFDSEHKRPLPEFPSRIGIITSPTGAAIRDILSVLRRRFPGLPALIYPAQVQGVAAAAQLIDALTLANRRLDCDLLVLARGGGSLEDLMPFNDESLARAIFASRLPVVSGVGHEIDFTIADFVADQRAATPSAAAELISPDRNQLLERIAQRVRRISTSFRNAEQQRTVQLHTLQQRLLRMDPRQLLLQQAQRLDELERRLNHQMQMRLTALMARQANLSTRIQAQSPLQRLERFGLILSNLQRRLQQAMDSHLNHLKQRLAGTGHNLDAVSPLATLQRGYSISRRLPERRIMTNTKDLSPGDQVETRLSSGRFRCRVESIETDEYSQTGELG